MDQILNSDLLRHWVDDRYLRKVKLETIANNFRQASPYPHIELPNFLNSEIIDKIVEELTQQEYTVKESDLFKFVQTEDFDRIDSTLLKSFKDMMRSKEFIQIIEFITGIPLSDDVDALGNVYRDTDYLLCHDDQLERRKIAYILYLTELFEEEGGSLNLFDSEDMYPKSIVKKIYPEFNKLVLFKVTPRSFHEVEEVRGEDVYRASISGWFNND